MSGDNIHGFAPHGNWGHPHSRDYKQIDCAAIGCKFNVMETCTVPSRCKINLQGSCDGFEAKETPKKVDGD